MKQPGEGTGPRTINGAALDVRGAAVLVGVTEKVIRGQVARRLIPFKRCGERIIYIRAELEQWLTCLPGCAVEEARANQEQGIAEL